MCLGRPRGALATVRALALATHLGPTVAVTVVATLLAVAADVPAGPGGPRLRGRPRRSGVHRLEQRLARRRPRPGRRPRRQAGRAGGGRPRDAAHRGAPGRSPRPSSCRSCWASCPGLLLLVLVASGWAYNAGLKRTAASVVPYVTGFGALPAGVVAAAPGRPTAPWWLVAAGGALGRGRPLRQRRTRSRGRPGDRRARPAAPPRRAGVRGRRVRCCSAGRRSCW